MVSALIQLAALEKRLRAEFAPILSTAVSTNSGNLVVVDDDDHHNEAGQCNELVRAGS